MDQVHSPCSDDILADDSETGAGIGTLQHRLDRYACGHQRTLQMSNYLKSQNEVKLSNRIARCGSYLVFNHYFTVDELRLIAADFCFKPLLCPFCAMRRGSKYLRIYAEKVAELKQQNPDLQCYFVTLTVKNGPDLMERINKLTGSFKQMTQARRSHLSNPVKNPHVEFAKAVGGVYAIETKRGEGSDLWHPHMHILWLGYEVPDQEQLSKEWKNWAGDSFIVHVKPVDDQENLVKCFLELFKYALKFSDMTLEDNWHAFKKLSGKRLINSFGCLRGVKVPEELADETIDDLPYLQIFYEWMQAARGYSLVPEKTFVVKKEQAMADYERKKAFFNKC
jgi:hypothetical protein